MLTYRYPSNWPKSPDPHSLHTHTSASRPRGTDCPPDKRKPCDLPQPDSPYRRTRRTWRTLPYCGNACNEHKVFSLQARNFSNSRRCLREIVREFVTTYPIKRSRTEFIRFTELRVFRWDNKGMRGKRCSVFGTCAFCSLNKYHFVHSYNLFVLSKSSEAGKWWKSLMKAPKSSYNISPLSEKIRKLKLQPLPQQLVLFLVLPN